MNERINGIPGVLTGDRVCTYNGICGTVIRICYGTEKPVIVNFHEIEYQDSFTIDGYANDSDMIPFLFFAVPHITIPPRPKQKTTVWDWVFGDVHGCRLWNFTGTESEAEERRVKNGYDWKHCVTETGREVER